MIISGSDVSDGGHFDIGHKAACTGFKTLCQARIFEGPEYGLNEGHEIDCPHCMQSWDGIEDAIERQFK